jgi:hypothetical protein
MLSVSFFGKARLFFVSSALLLLLLSLLYLMDLRQSFVISNANESSVTSLLKSYKTSKKEKVNEISNTYESMFPILDVKTHDLAIGEQLAACSELKLALELREKYVSPDFYDAVRNTPVADVRPDYENIKAGEGLGRDGGIADIWFSENFQHLDTNYTLKVENGILQIFTESGKLLPQPHTAKVDSVLTFLFFPNLTLTYLPFS